MSAAVNSNPGQALDPSAGEAADADDTTKAMGPLINEDVHNIRTDSTLEAQERGHPLQGGPGCTPCEAEKVPVGAEDEKDMQGLLGNLASTIQLHV